MDYYDKAVAYLSERPGEIFRAWDEHAAHIAGRLFSPVSRSRTFFGESPEYSKECGCLTQIRKNPSEYCSCDYELTKAILSDDRIPTSPDAVEVDDLPIFAQWQRRIDAALGRTPPVWSEPQESEVCK